LRIPSRRIILKKTCGIKMVFRASVKNAGINKCST